MEGSRTFDVGKTHFYNIDIAIDPDIDSEGVLVFLLPRAY